MNQFLDIGIPTAAQAASKVMRMGPNGPVPEFPMYAPAPQTTSPLRMLAKGGRVVPPGGYPPGTVGSTYIPGATLPEGVDPMAPIGATDPEQTAKMMALFSLLPPGTFGNMGSVSDPNIAASARTIADTRPAGGLQGQQFEEGYLETQKSGPLLGIWQSGLEDLLAEDPGVQARVSEMETERAERIAGLEESIPKLRPLSDLLKAGEFEEAFDYAQENGLVDQLMNTDNLKNLRGPFSKEEMSAFFNAIPPDVAKEYTGEGWVFDPSAGVEGSLDPLGTGGEGAMNEGFPDPSRAFTRKENDLVKNLVKIGGAAMLATAVPGLLPGAGGGAGTAGAAGTAAGTGGGALAGIQTAARTVLGIPQLIGEKVATALGAEAIGATGAKMIGNAVISGGITGAKGGDFKDVLKSAALAAGFTFVSDKAIQAVADKLQSTGITDAVKDLPAGGDATAAASSVAQNAASKIVDGLQEVVVTGSRFGDIAGGIGAAGALASAQNILKKSPAPDIEMPPDELEEVIVQSLREAPPRNIQDLLANLGTAGTQDILSEREIAEMQEAEQRMIDEQAAPEDIEEFTVETSRPITDYLNVPPFDLVDIPDATDVLRETPAPEVNYPDDMEEIIIETDRPGTDFLDVPPVDLVDFPDPTDIMKESPAPEINYPEKGPLEKLFDKYGTLENLIKLVGMVGAGKGSTGATAAPAPAYDPRASAAGGQWIDWEKVKADAAAAGQNLNTYVARNWNKIQNRALEAGMAQPTAPGYNMPTAPDLMQPGSEPTMSTQTIIPATVDGVEGYYAEGGMSRRVRGPGSGREDLIPALLSDGEYVIDAETMALLGDGSVEKAADLMDDFRQKIRKHKGAKLAKGGISPNAKSPLQYLMGK